MTTGWKKTRILTAAALFLGVAPFLLAGCDMDTKSSYEVQRRVQLVPGHHDATVPTADLNSDVLKVMADHYRHYGEGTLEVVVTYDPASRANTAMRATNEAARIASVLRSAKIHDVTADIMPVGHQESRTLINYRTITARAPDCATMRGLDRKPTAVDMDYEHGCTVETLMARQVARPQDLAGNDKIDPESSSGRRQDLIINTYVAGEPEPLEGVSTRE